MFLQQPLEEAPSGLRIPSRLQKHIDRFTVLVHRTPQIVLLAADLHEGFINEEGISVALMFSPESPGVLGTEFDTPQTDRLIADDYPTLG